ncbi:MAG: cell wall hydrolase [bacterium]|nr:cell wall hydrolase [bacterium]
MKMKKFIIILFLVISCVTLLIIGCNHKENKQSVENKTEVYQAEVTLRPSETIKTEELTENKENTNKESKNNNTYNKNINLSSDDILMLKKISVAEAGSESVESMALVMLVVLNRTYSEDFPDSVYEVIHQHKQFTPVLNGTYEKTHPNEKSEQAMKLVLSGWDESQGALYFETCEGSSWHSRTLDLLFEKDGIRFYTH